MAFEEFESCSQESFDKYLDKYIDQEWDLGSFDFLLQHFSKNTEISERRKCELLRQTYEYKANIKGKDEVFQFNFTDELISTIYNISVTSCIDENICQNIANIINNLSKVGLTSKDLYYGETNMNFAEGVTDLINDIFENGYNFKSHDILPTLDGLAKLGYKEEDLVDFKDNHLNIKALTQGIDNRIEEFEPQEIVDIFNVLVKLGYIKENLVDFKDNHLNIESLTEQIKSQIESFKPQEIDNVSNSNKNIAFEEFQSCDQESFDKCLGKYIDREWDLGSFDFLLQCFSENTKISEQEKYKLLTKIHEYEVNIDGENKVFQFKFIEELAETVYRLAIYKSGIDEYTCQNIANIINNLSKVGLTSKDLYFNGNMSFIEEVVTLINNIFNSEINKSGYNFKSQEIANTLNGLAKLGYRKEDLKDLNIKALMQQINNQIDNFTFQGMANTLNGLAKLGYRKEDLKDLNFQALTEQIISQIDNFNSQGAAVTLHGLGKIGYNFDELKESNIIQNLLKKFNSIQKNKTVLDYIILMQVLTATVYNINQDNLKEEQKQYLNNLKKLISKDVEQIIEEAKEKRPDINNETDLYNLDKVLMILENQQAELEQQTKKVIEGERRLEINIRRCENAGTAKMKYRLSATAEINNAFTNDAVLQKQ